MRYPSIALLMATAFATPLLSQTSGVASSPSPAVTRSRPIQPSAATLSPVKLEDQWTTALVRRDTRTFERLLAPNFVYTENASVMNRDDVIKSVTGSDRVEWARNEGMRLLDFGDVQVITGVLHLRGKGKQGSVDRRYH